MITLRPAVAFDAAGGLAVGVDGGIPAAARAIDLERFNKFPLLEEGVPVLGCFLAVALVLEEEGVEVLGLDPPDLLGLEFAAQRAAGVDRAGRRKGRRAGRSQPYCRA